MKRRLPVFLLVSLATHGVVMALLWRPDALPLEEIGHATPLAISMTTAQPDSVVATPPPAGPVDTRRTSARPTPPLAEIGPAPPDRAVPANTPPRPDRGDAYPATLVSEADTVSATTGARVYAELVDALAGQFDYPGVARQRGWQGMVRLGVHVAPDGSLRQIEVLHSSGYRVLDHAALLSLQKVAWLPAVSNWQIMRGFDMVVPVEYRLVDG